MRIKFNSLLYKTNRFHVAVCLFSNRSQKTLKCGKNISEKGKKERKGTLFKCLFVLALDNTVN